MRAIRETALCVGKFRKGIYDAAEGFEGRLIALAAKGLAGGEVALLLSQGGFDHINIFIFNNNNKLDHHYEQLAWIKPYNNSLNDGLGKCTRELKVASSIWGYMIYSGVFGG